MQSLAIFPTIHGTATGTTLSQQFSILKRCKQSQMKAHKWETLKSTSKPVDWAVHYNSPPLEPHHHKPAVPPLSLSFIALPFVPYSCPSW